MKLLIGVPTLDYMHVEFVKSLTGLLEKLRNDGIPFDLDIESGTLVYTARERIAHKAINEEYSHVLWLDADMVFQPTIFEDLLETGKDFVTGIYHARRKGYASCIFKTIDINVKVERFDEYPHDTFQIAGCGFGCVLVKTALMTQVNRTYGTCFTPLPNYGEDIAFCKRCSELGYKLWCEPTVVCGHIGHITIYPEDFELWKRSISNYDEVNKHG